MFDNDITKILQLGKESKFFSLRQNSENYIDFDGWLNQSSTENRPEVHVSLSFIKKENIAFLLLVEEQSGRAIGPEREMELPVESAMKILAEWKGAK
jgi:hypothetical protein